MKSRLFLLAAMMTAPVLGCSCVSDSPGFSQALPDTANASRAIFVGKVTEFYPQSRLEMNQLVDGFVRTHRDLLDALRTQSPNTTGRRIAGGSSGNLEWRKQMIEYIWADRLSPAEHEQLRAADERELDRLRFDQRRLAHLDVLENFVRADERHFTVYTALDGPACGFDFAPGETYLVEAYKPSGSDTWQVSHCSRTRLLSKATEDVNVLHAWKAGQRLPARSQPR